MQSEGGVGVAEGVGVLLGVGVLVGVPVGATIVNVNTNSHGIHPSGGSLCAITETDGCKKSIIPAIKRIFLKKYKIFLY